MYKMVLLSFVLVCFSGCQKPSKEYRTLQSSGYKDISLGITTPFHFDCGDDKFSTSFTATNPAGQKVSGTVCCGWIKSCTIRF